MYVRIYHNYLVLGGTISSESNHYPLQAGGLHYQSTPDQGGLHCSIKLKGVGPSMTLAWPGWKQSDIAVEVDTGRLETSRFKKCCANCVLLYFPSTEFKSACNVY